MKDTKIKNRKKTNTMFFQNSVIKKYLAALNPDQVSAAREVYKAYFLNREIQDNIRSSKEEQFQEGFLRELFVKVFGYTLNPSPNFNLITEQKNETDAKKADGAILRDDKVIGVIELKDHKTTDLSHVERQAFGYKSQHRDTRYVIISNFEKLRFYIDNAVEHIEWNLFTLTEDDFRLLYFCLAWPNISTDLPLKAKQESVSNEDHITQQLYRDYSAFKREIFADILANNTTEETPKEQILLLFRKTQKLLDRLLFIFFAEDCGLLPPNSMVEILNQWEQLKEMDEYVPLYNRIKKYFGYMNTGHQGKKYEIFTYNGGLFKPDEVLDSLIISDDILARFTRRLADYDYSTEVDVNILGHIFENSLNEIEEVTAQINNSPNGQPAPVLNRRKRDGVFYTPQYITKYIVENTVGRLCAEKKAEMGIDEAEYFADKNRQMATKKRLLDQLTQYREWLLGITICDPACGSGAFLNAALQFLMAEHKLLDEMEAKITGSAIAFQAVENSILENNLYGVDINEESVEIARLALWLRTAKPHRKLSSLNNNIKCGNSLISDPEIAGDKAFNWQAEFPQVFAKGGFDIVIGNPPYVRVQQLDYNITDYLKQTYKTALKRVDLSLCFIEKSRDLIKENGVTAFITSNQFLTTEYGLSMRRFLLNEYFLKECVDFGDLPIFDDAMTYVSIFVLSKQKYNEFPYYKVTDLVTANSGRYDTPTIISMQNLSENNWNLAQYGKSGIYKKIENGTSRISDIGNAYYGIVSGADSIFIFEKEAYEQSDIEKGLFIPLLRAQSCSKYYCFEPEKYILYPYKYENGETILLTEEELQNKYPNGWTYLLQNREELEKRKDSRSTFSGRSDWYCLTRFGLLSIFNKHKIVTPGEVKDHKFCIDYSKAGYSGARVFAVVIDDSNYDLNYVLCLLNSTLIKSYIQSFASLKAGGYYSYSSNILNQIPIPECADQQPFIDLADKMLSLNKDLQAKRARFLRRLQDNMPEVKVTGALETFDTLDFAGFVAELKKQKIKLSLVQQDEWKDYFRDYKTACNDLSAQIATTDHDIDTRVYALYGLTEEEIKMVEGA